MKKLFLITCIGFIAFIGLFITLEFIIDLISPNLIYKMDCVEDGHCKEGLTTLNEHSKEIYINKDNCIKQHWKWNDKIHYCDLY